MITMQTVLAIYLSALFYLYIFFVILWWLLLVIFRSFDTILPSS